MKIAILMSTYNGEKYLDKQIESLLNQTIKNIEIIIRDDGSTDNTKEILNNYDKFDNIKIIFGENIGVANSFKELINYNSDADIYFFCDQDDIWMNNKVENAMNMMISYNNIPCLYYSEVIAVDNSLNVLFKSNYTGIDTVGSSYNTTPVIGCTSAFNKKMKQFITEHGLPENIIMHDLFLYRVCLAIGGKVIHDNNSYIYYRQHDNNVVGITNSIVKKMRVYDKFSKTRRIMAKDILNLYGESISNENKIIINKIADYTDKMSLKQKISYIIDKDFKSNKFKSDLKFVYDVMNNKI